MRYIGRRFRTRSRRGKKRKGVCRFRLVLVFLGVLAVICAAVSEKGLSSISEELTKETARNYLVSTVNRAVNNQLESGKSSFVEVSRSGSGQVSAVSADSEAINRLKGNILTELTKELNGKCSVSVPIGSLSEVGLFNGRGFPVPIRLNFEGSADITFHTEFLSAGVNQTCHRITMVVRASVFSQSKRFEVYEETEISTVLSETVIVGEVPQFTTGFFNQPAADG